MYRQLYKNSQVLKGFCRRRFGILSQSDNSYSTARSQATSTLVIVPTTFVNWKALRDGRLLNLADILLQHKDNKGIQEELDRRNEKD